MEAELQVAKDEAAKRVAEAKKSNPAKTGARPEPKKEEPKKVEPKPTLGLFDSPQPEPASAVTPAVAEVHAPAHVGGGYEDNRSDVDNNEQDLLNEQELLEEDPYDGPEDNYSAA